MASTLPYYVNSASYSRNSTRSFQSSGSSVSFGLSSDDDEDAVGVSKKVSSRKGPTSFSERPRMPSMRDLLKDALQERPNVSPNRESSMTPPPKVTRQNRRNSWSSGMNIRDIADHEYAKMTELEPQSTIRKNSVSKSHEDEDLFGMFQWGAEQNKRPQMKRRGSSSSLGLREGTVRSRSGSLTESTDEIGSTLKRLQADLDYNKSSVEPTVRREVDRLTKSDHVINRSRSSLSSDNRSGRSSRSRRSSSMDARSESHSSRHSRSMSTIRDDKEKPRRRRSTGKDGPKDRKEKKKSKKDKRKKEGNYKERRRSERSLRSKDGSTSRLDRHSQRSIDRESSEHSQRSFLEEQASQSSANKEINEHSQRSYRGQRLSRRSIERVISERSRMSQRSIDLAFDITQPPTFEPSKPTLGAGKLGHFLKTDRPSEENRQVQAAKLMAQGISGKVTELTASTASSSRTGPQHDEVPWRPTFPRQQSQSTMCDSTVAEVSVILQFEPGMEDNVDRVRPDRSRGEWTTFEDTNGADRDCHITGMPPSSSRALLETSMSMTVALSSMTGGPDIGVPRRDPPQRVQRGTSFQAFKGVFQRQNHRGLSTTRGVQSSYRLHLADSDSEDDIKPRPNDKGDTLSRRGNKAQSSRRVRSTRRKSM